MQTLFGLVTQSFLPHDVFIPCNVRYTSILARYMEISMYLAICLLARYMEISMYLALCLVARTYIPVAFQI